MSRRAWLTAACAIFLASRALAANWPQWRGPAGDGTYVNDTLPLRWSETENVAWKCPLPDGASTPVIWGDAIFATGQDGDKLMLFRVNRDGGKVVWSAEVGTGTIERSTRGRMERGKQRFNDLHNLASPSPVTDGEVIVAHFGNGDLAAYDFAGKQLWKHNLQGENGQYTIWWGHANSPVLVNDLVVSVCMQDSLADMPGKPHADSYLVAHDKRTGARRWKVMRNTGAPKEEADAYTTPLLRTMNGRRELVVMGGNQLDAYDPATGNQLWYVPDLVGGRTVTGPTTGSGLIFATRGKTAPLLAVKIDGAGRLSANSIAWEIGKGTADSCSLVYHNGLLFWITDIGLVNCVDASTGKPVWSQQLRKGTYRASPIVADGRVYFLRLDGRCTVIAAASKFEQLAENTIDDETLASPAAADGRLYLRGRKALYCIK
jgi:outer membrane protein assembly factor BamB